MVIGLSSLSDPDYCEYGEERDACIASNMERQREDMGYMIGALSENQSFIAKLKQENERLKDALGDIVRRGNCSSLHTPCGECSWCIAHEALDVRHE